MPMQIFFKLNSSPELHREMEIRFITSLQHLIVQNVFKSYSMLCLLRFNKQRDTGTLISLIK